MKMPMHDTVIAMWFIDSKSYLHENQSPNGLETDTEYGADSSGYSRRLFNPWDVRNAELVRGYFIISS